MDINKFFNVNKVIIQSVFPTTYKPDYAVKSAYDPRIVAIRKSKSKEESMKELEKEEVPKQKRIKKTF